MLLLLCTAAPSVWAYVSPKTHSSCRGAIAITSNDSHMAQHLLYAGSTSGMYYSTTYTMSIDMQLCTRLDHASLSIGNKH
jgi:hypothetical protein